MNKKTLAALTLTWFTTMASASDIADFFAELTTFSGDFSQTVYQDGKLLQASSGQVALKKPLKFRWDYEVPEKMQLISDGEHFYHYDIELAQATTKPVEEIAGSALATLLNDENQIDEVFEVRSFGAPAVKRQFPEYAAEWLKKANLFYTLTPRKSQKNQDDDLQSTRVVIGITADKRLTVFYAEDAYGKNAFLFNNVEQNAHIADKYFHFNAPDGVDVLGQ